jgi:fructuronate reductase
VTGTGGRLRRAAVEAERAAPVRAVHLGLGAFHRAHQAWYTAGDPEHGIAAYSFRDRALPTALAEQDGLFTLLVRGDGEARTELVGSISRAHPGGDTARWEADLADAGVAVVTLTITEAGYQSGPASATDRLLAGLRRRHREHATPVALVPCDNVADNATVLRGLLRAGAEGGDRAFASWLEDEVAVVGTVVDRITPATTEADRAEVTELTGFDDRAPVVAESFTDWLLCGRFPAGRPAWEARGAAFVPDLRPYQQRKLWLLNGAHLVLAYAGRSSGHHTVDEAMRDPEVAALVESWWDTVAPHALASPAELDDYRTRLRSRFTATGIRHQLAQIGVDGSRKIPARLLPVLRAERAAGRLPEAAVAVLAEWIGELRAGTAQDPDADVLTEAAGSAEPVCAVLAHLDDDLAGDTELVRAVTARGKVPR